MATVATSATASTAPVTVAVRESFVNDFIACWFVGLNDCLLECGQSRLRRGILLSIQHGQDIAETISQNRRLL